MSHRNSISADLQRALINACYNGHVNRVRTLLKQGAMTNVPDARGYYPLHIATQEGHTPIVTQLLAHGADPNLREPDGETACLRAAGAGHVETLRRLISAGADVGIKRNSDGASPLHCACAWGRTRTVTVLIEVGANLNDVDHDGLTPIFYAVEHKHLQTVQLLANSGADMQRSSATGLSLMDIARSTHEKKIIAVVKRFAIQPLRGGKPPKGSPRKTKRRAR